MNFGCDDFLVGMFDIGEREMVLDLTLANSIVFSRPTLELDCRDCVLYEFELYSEADDAAGVLTDRVE